MANYSNFKLSWDRGRTTPEQLMVVLAALQGACSNETQDKIALWKDLLTGETDANWPNYRADVARLSKRLSGQPLTLDIDDGGECGSDFREYFHNGLVQVVTGDWDYPGYDPDQMREPADFSAQTGLRGRDTGYLTVHTIDWSPKDQLRVSQIVGDLVRTGADAGALAWQDWAAVLTGRKARPWHDHQADLARVSLRWPDVTFTLTGDGEGHRDRWREYYRNGLVQTVAGELRYPDYRVEELQDPSSLMQPPHQNITV